MQAPRPTFTKRPEEGPPNDTQIKHQPRPGASQGGILLATVDGDLGLIPANATAEEAARLAQQTGEQVSLRDPITDEVLGVVAPGGNLSSAKPDRSPHAPPNKRKLTELYCRKVKPRATAFVVWDTLQRGLVLRVQPSSRRSFNVIYNRHGRTRWLHLADAEALGLSEARQLAAEAMLAVARGGDPASEKRAKRSSGTFGELAERYVKEYAVKHNKSYKQAASLVARFALPRWGRLQASAITRSDVRALLASVSAPVVCNQTLSAISAVMTWGTNNELIPINPCHGIKTPNPTATRDRVLSESELPGVWEALGDLGVAGRCLKTILLTGQRPGEVSACRYEHIDSGWWTLPGAPVPSLGWGGTKNKQTHRIWLPAPVRELIGEGTTGFVFATGPRGRPVRSLDAVMREVSRKLGIDPARPHDCRRTHLTILASLGFGRQALDRIANHSDRSIASTYDRHSYAVEDQKIMESVANRIVELAEGRVADNVLNFTR